MAKRYAMRADGRHDIEGIFFDFVGARRGDGRIPWEPCVIVAIIECSRMEGLDHTAEFHVYDGSERPILPTATRPLIFEPATADNTLRAIFGERINEGVTRDNLESAQHVFTVPGPDTYHIWLLVDGERIADFAVDVA